MKRAEARAAGGQLEVRARELGGHGRGEGAELLAVLDARGSGGRASPRCAARPGCCGCRARAGRAPRRRPSSRRSCPLASARRDVGRGAPSLARPVLEWRGRPPRRSRASSVGVDGRAPVGVVGNLAVRAAEVDAVGVERGAERAARVARRGRDEQLARSRTRAGCARWRRRSARRRRRSRGSG